MVISMNITNKKSDTIYIVMILIMHPTIFRHEHIINRRKSHLPSITKCEEFT